MQISQNNFHSSTTRVHCKFHWMTIPNYNSIFSKYNKPKMLCITLLGKNGFPPFIGGKITKNG